MDEVLFKDVEETNQNFPIASQASSSYRFRRN